MRFLEPRTTAKNPVRTSRRSFLKGAAAVGAGLTLAFSLPLSRARAEPKTSAALVPAFLRIAPDNTVTVIIKHHEMGQGVTTGLTTIVAEELDADMAQMRFEFAPANAELYNNLSWGPYQGTGGSSSVANSFEQLRKAGATARAMVVAAAAAAWSVPAGEITVVKGVVSHAGSGNSGTLGEFADAAGKVAPPADAPLKDPSKFTLIGHHNDRLDSVEKTTGKTIYTQDIHFDGMLTAVVAHAPVFGGKVKSFDASGAKAVGGVVEVVQIPQGVAVIAKDTWSAMKGREALKVEWDIASGEVRGSEALFAEYRQKLAEAGHASRKDGDSDGAIIGAAKVIEGEYEFPYLAHAPMEPMNCVIKQSADGIESWSGHQGQTMDQAAIAKVFGVEPTKVKLNTLMSGGSFGRRATFTGDYVVEAAEIVKAIQGRSAVKLMWTREDDMRAGYFRPMYIHKLRAGLDASGKIVGWQHRIVGQPLFGEGQTEGDASMLEGAATLPYDIANVTVDTHNMKVGVPVLWWRSVGHTHNAFAVETFVDELATTAGQDPLAFRQALLAKHPRHLAVLNLAAEKAGWGTSLGAGKARGVAVHESFDSFVAQVAEVTIGADGRVKVDRVVCAVDCGIAINPDIIAAQMEGGIGFGLSAALYGAITLKDGSVEQSNFHDYEVLRIDMMPKVEVHIVPSTEKPTGVGEPGVPPIAPAVANAIAAATGQRLRILPFKRANVV
jgi:isoquinoline 1-oxidoreductase beta subunit